MTENELREKLKARKLRPIAEKIHLSYMTLWRFTANKPIKMKPCNIDKLIAYFENEV